MRFYALLAFALSSVASVHAVFADDAYHIDYHQALLGAPQPETTFFHRPSSSSSASLLYTISDQAILGAVNPKDGSLVWRQSLADGGRKSGLLTEDVMEMSGEEPLKDTRDIIAGTGGFLAKDGSGSVLSYYASVVSKWDAMNGRLVWQKVIPEGMHVVCAKLIPASPDKLSSENDVVVLYGNEAGAIMRLDGSSGAVVWEYIDRSGASPRLLVVTKEEIYYGSEQSALLGANSLKITHLDKESGRENKAHYSLKTDATPYTASCSDLAFISWYEKSSNSIKVNVLGSSKMHSMILENSAAEEIDEVHILPACEATPFSHFLVHIHTSRGAWAEMFHIHQESGEVGRAYSLPRLMEKDAFAVSNINEKLYVVRTTDREVQLHSLPSGDVLARWPRTQPSFGGPSHVQAEVVVKGDSNYAIRVSEVSRGGEWTLMRNGEPVWSRPEMLADVAAAAWADDISDDALAHELDLEGHGNPLYAYIHRLKRHARDLEYLPVWIQQLPSSFWSGLLTSKNEAEKGLLGSKSLIVATSTGHYLALDPAKAGAIKWKKFAQQGSKKMHSLSLYVKDGIVTSYADGLGTITINATNGEEISYDPSETHFTSIAIAPGPVSPVAYHILQNGQPEATAIDDVAVDGTYLVTRSESGSEVQGWMVGQAKKKLWTFSRGTDSRIANLVARPVDDPVSSIAKVLGDRSVLYKYLSRNLALVTSVQSDSFTIDLIDSITGTILHSITHQNVDTESPVPSVISENWFAYSFFGNENPTSPSKSHQLVVVELYESSIPNDRGSLQSSSNYSSFSPGSITIPHTISQSFTISQPISHMSVTQTAQGITSRQLLCTLPNLNAVISIPRYILDPRRPTDRDPTPQEASEEGLFRYSPILDLDAKFFLSHAREVMGIRKIISAPTLLESTSLVFAFGLDIFGTRVTPSKAFDVLGKGFNKIALILTVVALGVGTAVLAPLVRRKQVERAWRM